MRPELSDQHRAVLACFPPLYNSLYRASHLTPRLAMPSPSLPSTSGTSSGSFGSQWMLPVATTALACAAAAGTVALTSYFNSRTSPNKPTPSPPLSFTSTSLPPHNFPSTLSTASFGPTARSQLFSLRPHTTFLNHGSYGAVPRLVQQYQQQLNQRVESHPDLWFRFHSYPLVREAAGRFARFIGAASGQDVVFVSNATSAVNAVLSSLQLQADDVIFTPDLTYNACKLAMQSVCQRTGASYMEVKVPLPSTAAGMVERVKQFLDANADKRIKFALFDIITSPTAVVFPYEEVCSLCRSRGVPTMLDAAHSLGQLPLRVSESGCDYLTTNCHKWCFGPKGTALLWVSPDAPAALPIHPSVTSHLWREQSLAKRFWMQGTRDDTAFVAAAAGLAFYESIGIDRVYQYCTSLADWAVEHLTQRWQVRPYPLYERSISAPFMRVLELPVDVPADVKAAGGELLRQFGDRTLERFLSEYDMVVACFVYAEKLYVRFSVQMYNCEDDYVKLGELVLSLQSETK